MHEVYLSNPFDLLIIIIFISFSFACVFRSLLHPISFVGTKMDDVDEERTSRLSAEIRSQRGSKDSRGGDVLNALRVESQGELELKSPTP